MECDATREIVLGPAAAVAFMTALEAPAAVNHILATALSRPRRFRWIAAPA